MMLVFFGPGLGLQYARELGVEKRFCLGSCFRVGCEGLRGVIKVKEKERRRRDAYLSEGTMGKRKGKRKIRG